MLIRFIDAYKTCVIKLSCIFCLLLLLPACAINKNQGPTTITTATPIITDRDRELAALAFIAYTGELLKGSDREVERILAPCLQKELALQDFTQGKYELIWGPSVYKFELAELDDNMIYVVRSLIDPSRLVIAIRGTNGTAILDWLVEDFAVFHKVKWPYGNPGPTLKPKISEGTHTGLKILQSLSPAAGTPGEKQTIAEFLKQIVTDENIRHISVVGHSLGGALSPALALWLVDTRSYWDPENIVEVSVLALAGPTPGDKDFSSYYDDRLGANTKRVHNPYDVVALAWDTKTMKTIPNLYKPSGIKTPIAIEVAILAAVELVKNKHYTQIMPDAAPLSGKVYLPKSTFLEQVGWQHSCGYYCDMQLLPKLKPIAADCNETPKATCTVCP